MNFRKIFFSLLLVFALANGLVLLSDYAYVYRAIWYFTADIDDYGIFENRVVKSEQHLDWLVAANYNKVSLPKTLNNVLEKLQSVAFLVIKDDSIVYEKYWNGYSDSSISNSFSVAKSIVSILTGVALNDGKIKNLEQPVADFLPEFKEEKKSDITIRHLLTMTSGLNFQEAYMSPISHTTEAYYGTDLKKLIKKLIVVKEPGTEFNYKSGDTEILGMVLVAATGKSLSEYASEKLWSKIGSRHDALWSLDKKDGMEKAFCCFNSNTRDFARIGKLYLQKGKWGGEQIVPEEYVALSLQPLNIKDNQGGKVDYYGYLWWLMPNYKGHDIFYARGISGQYVIVIPDKNIIIVRLGKNRGAKVGEHYDDVYMMIDGVLEADGRNFN